MKKIIIGLSGVVVMTVAILLFTNASISAREGKKGATEVSKSCAKSPATATCTEVAGKTEMGATATCMNNTGCKNMACDPAKCKAAGCDMTKCKEGKCDQTNCKMASTEGKGEMKSCDQAKCPMASKVK